MTGRCFPNLILLQEKISHMRISILISLFLLQACQALAQHSLSLHAGYLGTYTRIAEYERIDRFDHLLDSMSLSKSVGSFQAALAVDFDLGKNVYLSTGFHYSRKGLAEVVFTDSTGWPWKTAARQYYAGLSVLVGYKHTFGEGPWGFKAATGLQADFAVGTPNAGALFSAPYYRFFMPFCRFDETDLGWLTEATLTRRLGPGNVELKLNFLYGLSDVLEDAFVIGRPLSAGITVGYSLPLGN